MPRNMNMNGKVVLVTGSTDGVGRLVARRLAEQGARVLIHGRNSDRGKELLEQIRAARGSAVFVPADFSSLNEVRRLADVVRQESIVSTSLSTMLALARAAPLRNGRPVTTAMSCASPSITLPGSCSRDCCCLL